MKESVSKGLLSFFSGSILILGISFLLISCSRSPLLLKVGDISWTGKDFQKEVSLYLKTLPVHHLDDELIKKKVLEELIFRSLLEIWATKRIKNWPDLSSSQEKQEFFRKNLLELLPAPISPSEKELKAFYQKHKKSFHQPEQCFFEQILVFKENLGRALYRKLLRGEDFETLAQLYSRSRKTEEISWVSKGTLKIFDRACAELDVGTFSQPLKSFYGFHILKLKEKKPAQQKSFAQVKEKILKQIRDESKESAFQEWLKKELKSSSVFLNEKLLDNIHIRYKKRLL